MTSPDPTTSDYWRPLAELQRRLDVELAGLYAERGLPEVSPRFVRSLIRLSRRGPMTIRALADDLGGTHSAVSQTVSAMRAAGLVRTAAGTDARTRVVHLTDHARGLVPLLEAEWRATDEAISALDAELPVHLTDYVAAMTARLSEHSFRDRVAARLESFTQTPAGESAER